MRKHAFVAFSAGLFLLLPGGEAQVSGAGFVWVGSSSGLKKIRTTDAAVLLEIGDGKDCRVIASDGVAGTVWCYGPQNQLRSWTFEGTPLASTSVPVPLNEGMTLNGSRSARRRSRRSSWARSRTTSRSLRVSILATVPLLFLGCLTSPNDPPRYQIRFRNNTGREVELSLGREPATYVRNLDVMGVMSIDGYDVNGVLGIRCGRERWSYGSFSLPPSFSTIDRDPAAGRVFNAVLQSNGTLVFVAPHPGPTPIAVMPQTVDGP